MVRREGSEFCPECGAKNREKYRPVYCSRPCRLKAYNRKAYHELGRKEWYQEYNEANVEKRREYRAKQDNRKRAGYESKRRVRKFTNAPYENVDFNAVFERDEWICQLCLDPVDSNPKWPEPMSPSADHVIPIAKGGGHNVENLQLAHLRCNISKGAKIEGGE